MRVFWLFSGFLMIAALVIAGCVNDPTGVLLGKDTSQEISGTIEPVASGTSTSSGTWVLWREIPLDKPKGWAYSMNRPNLDQRYFRDLKVEVSADAPVNVRFVTLKQCDEYQKEYDRIQKENSAYYNPSYDYKNPTIFDPQRSGYVKFFQAISDTSVEAHGSEELVFILEPFSSLPVKGTMKVYYQP